jgi:hypothetical protein
MGYRFLGVFTNRKECGFPVAAFMQDDPGSVFSGLSIHTGEYLKDSVKLRRGHIAEEQAKGLEALTKARNAINANHVQPADYPFIGDAHPDAWDALMQRNQASRDHALRRPFPRSFTPKPAYALD